MITKDLYLLPKINTNNDMKILMMLNILLQPKSEKVRTIHSFLCRHCKSKIFNGFLLKFILFQGHTEMVFFVVGGEGQVLKLNQMTFNTKIINMD